MNTWQKYVRTVVGETTQTEAGHLTRLGQPTIGRWLKGTHVPTEAAKAAAFAAGFKRNVLEAFVAAQMLSIEDAGAGLSADERRFLTVLLRGDDTTSSVAKIPVSREVDEATPLSQEASDPPRSRGRDKRGPGR